VRGRQPVDMDALEKLLVRFSQLISEQHFVKELDINPLMASPETILALDARVVLFDKNTPENALPKLAIRPYPNKYVENWTMKDGRQVVIRPIRAEDEPLMSKFHEGLSDRTVFMRYLSPMLLSDRVAHERLARMTHNDYDREIALVVEGEENGERAVFGVARLSKLRGAEDEARLSMLISDRFQGQGIGKELIKRIIDVARNEQIKHIIAATAPDNEAFINLCRKSGFSTINTNQQTGMLEAIMNL
jgi:acetyltransferase